MAKGIFLSLLASFFALNKELAGFILLWLWGLRLMVIGFDWGRPERRVLGVLEPDTWQGEPGSVILAHLFFHGPRPTLNGPRSTPEIVNNKPKSI